MAGFSDIPIRTNDIDSFIDASWWNTIRTKLIELVGDSSGYKINANEAIAAGGEITTFSATAHRQMMSLSGSGGPVTISTTPFGNAHGFNSGQEVVLMGNDNTNTVEIPATDIDYGFAMNGKIVLSKYKTHSFIWREDLLRFVRKE